MALVRQIERDGPRLEDLDPLEALGSIRLHYRHSTRSNLLPAGGRDGLGRQADVRRFQVVPLLMPKA